MYFKTNTKHSSIMPSLKSNMDVYEPLHITRNCDGSLTRNYPFPFTSTDDEQPWPVVVKDISLNSANNTSIRIFVPKSRLNPNQSDDKLPVIIYFHGGGFILASPAVSPVHDFTSRMASELPAVVLSVDHRLAPEHRLPAAYDDAVDALLWVRDGAASEPLMEDRVDFSRVFLMGSSSGGNIVYNLALRTLSLDLEHVKIAGLIMDQPFFGGEERTESETRMADDPLVPVAVTDVMWEFSLPLGADRDHEYSKPKKLVREKGEVMPRCWVKGCLGDPLIDRMKAVVTMLEEGGVRVVKLLDGEGVHGAEMFDASKAEAMVDDLREFIYE